MEINKINETEKISEKQIILFKKIKVLDKANFYEYLSVMVD
jgi:hypothetical protein